MHQRNRQLAHDCFTGSPGDGASDAADPSTQTSTPYFPVVFDISHYLLGTSIATVDRLGTTLRQLDLQMNNRPVGQSVTRPAQVGEDLEHQAILGQDIGYESPYPMSFCDLGQMSEQRRSDAAHVVLMSDNDPDVSSGRVIGDRVIRYTNELVRIECAESALPTCRLGHLANELVETNLVQREEAEVSIMVGEVFM